MKKKILLTGSNGFIGKSFIEGLDKDRYDIFGLDFKPASEGAAFGIKDYFPVDISQPFTLRTSFDAVIHLAALNQTNINSNFAYEKFKAVNVDGTRNVANSCTFKKFVFFSTANLYERPAALIDEETPLQPVSFYEHSKYEAELVCRAYIESDKLVILRPVNVTGVLQENKAIVPFFFSKAIRNEAIEVFVPENRRIQLLSVRDLQKAIEAVVCDASVHGIFNLAGKENIEVKALAEKIIALCSSQSSVICTNGNLESYSAVSADKARKILNWQAQDSIDTIVNEYAQFVYSSKGHSPL